MLKIQCALINSWRILILTTSKPTKYYSELQEKHVAKALDGKKVPASGAAKFVAGDVVITNSRNTPSFSYGDIRE